MNANDRLDLRSKWRQMPESTRRYLVIGMVVAALILVAVIATYVTPGVYPSGE